MNRCVLICASPETNIDFCRSVINDDDFIVCADGGMDTAQKLNIVPHLTVGDFDSSTSATKTGKEIITLPKEKDDTDSMYCIKEIIKRGYKDIVILGGLGARADHTFANITSLVYMAKNGCNGVLLNENNQIVYCNSNYTISNMKENTVSVFPFACENAEVSLNGFYYPLDHYTLSADFPLGTSNVLVSDKAKITVHSGGVIIMVNNAQTK